MKKVTISRRKFIERAGLLGAGLFSSAASSGYRKSESSRPNILFLLTDDQRWDTLSCAGNPVLQTPNVDRLAENGVLFTNAFVTTSICPANRACIFSGKHMRSHGISGFDDSFSPKAFLQTYPALMREAGYRTGFIGKYGVGETLYPRKQFDFWQGFDGPGSYFQEVDGNKVHSSRMMADQCSAFLRGSSKTQPWCLSVSFKAPHHPWNQFDPELGQLYNDLILPLGSSATSAAETSQPSFIRDSLSGSRWWNIDDDEIQGWLRDYYRLVKGMDLAVGRIVKSLDELGFSDNTVIVFTSDNGYLLYEHGLMGKWLMYEESIRIPMIVYDPRLPGELRGRRRDEMVLSIDCAPTLLAMAGIEIPSEMQGRDLTPLILGQAPTWREDWYYEHTHSEPYPRNIPRSQGVRTERWKYIRYIDENPRFEQLFDLENDPSEMSNLAADTGQEKTLEHLRQRLDYWREELPNVDPDRFL